MHPNRCRLRAVCTAGVIGLVSFAAAAEVPIEVLFSGSPGEYTRKQWQADWPGCRSEDGIEEGRVTLVSSGDERWLRVTCRAGQIGPADGGAGWRWPFGRHESAEATYRVRFAADFEFVRGGKLPGLAGGPENVTGGKRPTGENGFSARIMWRRDGRGEVYVYHLDQPDDTGESLPFPPDFRFPCGTPVRLRLAVTMNRPGQRDGIVRCWATLPDAAEQLLVERTNLCWRTVDTFGVDSLYFQAFHGGSTSEWAPPRDCAVEFADLRVTPPQTER